jgi:predicted alpha/beta hydrolase family esterase
MDVSNALIIHGTCEKSEYFSDNYPSLSNSHWIPWLQKQLLINSIFTQTPEMPNAYMPVYQEWKHEFEKYSVNENTILVGHSCGGGFLVRWLSENQIKIAKLILVAPWLDPDHEKTPDLFNFEIDKNLALKTSGCHLLYSENDTEDVIESVKKIINQVPDFEIHKFKYHGHFTYAQMLSRRFPELLDVVMGTPNKTRKDVLTNLLLKIKNMFL